jgi:hypothetical protein
MVVDDNKSNKPLDFLNLNEISTLKKRRGNVKNQKKEKK